MKPTRTAFSLVELSIVLVILGLLVGGILAGQSLIRASELRAVGAEHSRYRTAVLAFRDKYMGLPGDIANATDIWGKDATNRTMPGNSQNCSSASGTASASGTCNGNGDGRIAGWTGVLWEFETYRSWQQLALAGLIEGTYNGYPPPANGTMLPGSVIPASKLNNAGWAVYHRDLTAVVLNSAPITFFSLNNGNFFTFGGPSAGTSPNEPVLTPTESWNIDTKLDDGMPGRGSVTMRSTDGACTNAASSIDFNATYALSVTTISCGLWFRNQF